MDGIHREGGRIAKTMFLREQEGAQSTVDGKSSNYSTLNPKP